MRIIYIIIALVVLVLATSFFLGGFDGLKKAVAKINPIDVGADKLKGQEPTVMKEHEEAINQLAKKIEEMAKSPDKECFGNYGNLPALGEGGTQISFEVGDGKTKMVILGGAGGKQEVLRLEKELDFKPCVIAGGEVPKNFHNKFLKNPYGKYSFVPATSWTYYMGGFGSHYTLINKIFLTAKDKEKNSISYDGGKPAGLDDGGYLFKAKEKTICFFPTKKGSDASGIDDCDGDSPEGLDNNCLGEAEGDDASSVIHRLSEGRLKYCLSKEETEKISKKEKSIRYLWVEFFGQGEDSPPSEAQVIRAKCLEGKECFTARSDNPKGNCDTEFSLGGKGCLVIASDSDPYNNDCGSAELKIGTVLPSGLNRWQKGLESYQSYLDGTLKKKNREKVINLKLDGGVDALNLIAEPGFKWHAGDYPLICANDRTWHECNELTLGETLELRNKFGTEAEAKCIKVIVKEGQKEQPYYFWSGTGFETTPEKIPKLEAGGFE